MMLASLLIYLVSAVPGGRIPISGSKNSQGSSELAASSHPVSSVCVGNLMLSSGLNGMAI
jgi:hypothetical protein